MKKVFKYMLYIIVVLILGLFSYMKVTHQNTNEVGLKILSMVKKIKGQAVDLTTLNSGSSMKLDHQLWTQLLAVHVAPNGNVDYKGFIADQARLDQYLKALSNNPPDTKWNDNDQMAYWINAYNAFTVKLIIDHYPLVSIRDIAGGLPMINSPWDIKFFKIGSIDFDLNTIEHQILRKEFDDPRIHFAINCASFSCPKLRKEAFTGAQLQAQLDDQSRAFIHNMDKNIITAAESKLSSIFSWFAGDFTKHESIGSFVKKYHASFNEENSIEYLDYNWTLNE